MDFVVKLLKSRDLVTRVIYNLIIVIVDKLTKYSILILFKELYTAE